MFLWMTTAQAAERPPRVGIISDQSMKAHADLLMIEMQKQKVELVERDEIDKVMREHSLSIAGLTGQDSLKVGQLLKADGLVLIETQKKDASLVRLVAVAPGVMIWYGELSTKDKPETWSKTVVATLEPYVMKLSVKKGEAIPISLLRVKPAIGTTVAKQLAIDLNQLLLLQMVRRPSLFVLERENLRRVEEEQHFSGQVSEFWTGSYVVDTVAGHDLLDTNKVSLSLVVQPPQTGKRSTGTELKEQGKSDELPAIAARMCDKLCGFVGVNTNTSGWDAKTEGRQFLALASSLSNLEEKKSAYETAMALGCRDSKTAGLYREVLRNRLDKKGPWMSEFVVATHKEVAEQGRQLLEMLEFHESYRPPEGFTTDSERTWLYAYWQPLDDLGRFLEGVHKQGFEDEVGETLPTLREIGRRLVARTWLNDNYRPAARRHTGIASDGVRYLYSSAADIIRVLRTMGLPLCADSLNDAYLHHKPLLRREAVEPVYSGNDTEPESTRKAMWRSFVEEAKTSDTPKERLAYWSEQLTKATNENARMCARGGLQLQLWTDLGYVVSNTTDLASYITHAYGDKSVNRPESCFLGGNNSELQRALSLFLWMCGS
jgi:hypothetical protein